VAVAFVTGANGFIGQHLVARLVARGDRARRMIWRVGKRLALPDGEPADDTLVAPLDDVEAVAAAMSGADVVYHLAGRTAAYDRGAFDRANARGVADLFVALERARPAPGRLVLVSSAMAAGPSHAQVPRAEAHRVVEGRTLYGDSKLAGERHAFERAARIDTEVVVVRPPMVYGPGDRDVLQLLRSARLGVIAQPGLRPVRFSALYVDDLVEGLVAAAERGRPLPRTSADHVLRGGGAAPDRPLEDPLDPRGQGIYYLADGTGHTATEFGRLAAAAMGRKAIAVRFPGPVVYGLAFALELLGRAIGRLPTLTVDKARGSLAPWCCDDQRARTELGFAPRHSLAAGLAATVASMRGEPATDSPRTP
jgi:nucleoside-diphosphate-sugar epimerase